MLDQLENRLLAWLLKLKVLFEEMDEKQRESIIETKTKKFLKHPSKDILKTTKRINAMKSIIRNIKKNENDIKGIDTP